MVLEIIKVIKTVFIMDIFLEIGRVFNMIYGNSLKTSGDAVYTVIVAVISMFVFAVGGTYVFGIALSLAVFGCYFAMSLDELFRGMFMIFRWRSKKWMNKSLIKHDDEELGDDIDTLLAKQKMLEKSNVVKVIHFIRKR